jgi:DNA-binding SARP family transcriptional activator
MIGHDDVPPGALPESTRRSVEDLRMPIPAAERALDDGVPGLATGARRQLLGLAGGRVTVFAAARAARSVLGAGTVEGAINRASGVDGLLTLLAEALLFRATDDARRALGLAVQLEYAHPALTAAVLGGGELPPGPWVQRLDDGWARIRTAWRAPLRSALGRRILPGRDTLHAAADQFLGIGAVDRAVPLYLALRDNWCAARAITSVAGDLMDLGQWDMLNGWLAQLPGEVFAQHPELVQHRAEIAAARGDVADARRWFGLAASRFAAHDDADGACSSMLAVSAIAADSGDLVTAQARASAAGSLADAAGLAAHEMWAAWQQGRLALAAGDTESALASFDHAASVAGDVGDASAAEPIRSVDRLTRQVRDLRRRQEFHREALAALEHAERDTFTRLMESVTMSPNGAEALVGRYGWSRTPMPLKLAVCRELGDQAISGPTGLWERLRRTAWVRRDATHSNLPHPHAGHGPGHDAPRSLPSEPRATVAVLADQPEVGADRRHGGAGGDRSDRSGTPASASVLAVHLLGTLCVTIDDIPVEEWSGGRNRSLFAYLLIHRDPWPPREALMAVFWPGSTPEAARNSLNVAIHGLRRVLRTATDAPVIVLAGAAYRLHPDLRLWLDVEEFERRVEHGRRREQAGDLDKAMNEYERATALYRGDFLADDPYDDWPVLIRERLRLAHLDALDRLSDIYYRLGRYASAATLCQHIIERDPCREDAHRRLMRCYSRQGQPHLALLQYRSCARVLADELGVRPAPATIELHDRIRHHKPV